MTKYTNLASNEFVRIPKLHELMGRHFRVFNEVLNEANYSSKIPLPYNTLIVSDDHYRIELALAGYKEDDLKINVFDDTLHISTTFEGSAALDEAVEDENDIVNISKYPHYMHCGIRKKGFHLKFGIPKDATNFTAIFKDGLLTIDIVTQTKKANNFSIAINGDNSWLNQAYHPDYKGDTRLPGDYDYNSVHTQSTENKSEDGPMYAPAFNLRLQYPADEPDTKTVKKQK